MKLAKSNYIRIYSDIHLDSDIPKKNYSLDALWIPEKLDTDKETTLILAGDIWHAKKAFAFSGDSWLKSISKNFQYILIVLGNHDFWGGNLSKEYKRFQENINEQELNNIFLLQNNSIEIGEHKFIGATLWTDFLNGNKIALEKASSMMNDYKFIKNGSLYSKLRSQAIFREHILSKRFIFENAKKDFENQKLWIITHHLPSRKSLNEEFDLPHLEIENSFYYSNLDNEIEGSEIDFWIHGHSHFAKDYMIGKTRVIANPRGYRTENSQYNPWHLMDLD